MKNADIPPEEGNDGKSKKYLASSYRELRYQNPTVSQIHNYHQKYKYVKKKSNRFLLVTPYLLRCVRVCLSNPIEDYFEKARISKCRITRRRKGDFCRLASPPFRFKGRRE